jgi:hypothetical protein
VVKCAGISLGIRLPVEPGSFEDFEDDFPSLLVRAQPGGVLRILRMRLRRVPSLKAGTHKGAGTPTRVGSSGRRVLKEADPSMRAGPQRSAGTLMTVGTATEEGIL